MSVAIIIPARLGSTRLKQKMLLSDTGWPLIRHVYEQAKKSVFANRVLIATDDDEIYNAVREFGGEVVMTSPHHPTGTDRVAEVAVALKDIDLIVNVQGDEPELEPQKIDTLIQLYQTSDAAMATLVTRFSTQCMDATAVYDPNCVKAVLGSPILGEHDKVLGYRVLYFSRSPIPYPRDSQGAIRCLSDYFLHVGIYAYSPTFLKQYVSMPQSKLELTEKLEQLRILENGYTIAAAIVDTTTPGIDTQEDYNNFVKRWRKSLESVGSET